MKLVIKRKILLMTVVIVFGWMVLMAGADFFVREKYCWLAGAGFV